MAITTYAQVRSKIQFPRDFLKNNSGISGYLTTWNIGSFPIAGSYDTTLNGVTLTSPITGQIAFPAPVATGYLSRMQLGANNACVAFLNDRLWHNGGINATLNTAQNITSPTWPARDINGATTGEGVLIGVEISATMGAATPTITVSYTNTAGTNGRTATNIQATGSADPTSRFIELSLQAGDTGVKSIESITLSTSWISGTMNLVVYRPIGMVNILANTLQSIDALTGCLPLLYSGSVPYITYRSSSASNLYGKILFSDG